MKTKQPQAVDFALEQEFRSLLSYLTKQKCYDRGTFEQLARSNAFLRSEWVDISKDHLFNLSDPFISIETVPVDTWPQSLQNKELVLEFLSEVAKRYCGEKDSVRSQLLSDRIRLLSGRWKVKNQKFYTYSFHCMHVNVKRSKPQRRLKADDNLPLAV
jgi:hypothetical protein